MYYFLLKLQRDSCTVSPTEVYLKPISGISIRYYARSSSNLTRESLFMHFYDIVRSGIHKGFKLHFY